MIRDVNMPLFLRRLSDRVYEGRNRTRIVLGTDRLKEEASGWGDGGENDLESGTIDIVAGYQGEHPEYTRDKSRLYVSGKTDPDSYFGIEAGENVRGEPSVVGASDNVYMVGRKRVKIIGPNCSIVITDGEIEIKTSKSMKLKSGEAEISIGPSGEIYLGNSDGIGKKIITEDDICVGVAPSGGGPVACNFKIPASGIYPVINNQKVKIK